MVTFTSRDDAREAYRAGLSGAKDFTAKSKDAEIAFFQGAKSNIENTQGDRPEDFKDEVYEQVKDIDGKLIVKEYPTKSATTNTIKAH